MRMQFPWMTGGPVNAVMSAAARKAYEGAQAKRGGPQKRPAEQGPRTIAEARARLARLAAVS
jgi:hypothetical protein